MSAVRLHKAIAEAGIASRRTAEEMIRDGRVSVNGETVTGMGVLVDPGTDEITVDGRRLEATLRKRTYLLNKPAGLLCARSDPHGRRTVYDLLPPEVARGLHSAGRLDLDAEGMLILTNDGELSQALTHPSRHHHKTYLVRFRGKMDRGVLKKIRGGVKLDEGMTLPAEATLVPTLGTERETALILVLREGKKNQIKRMGLAVGHRVISIRRTAIGRLQLPPKMKPGTYKRLSPREIASLTAERRTTETRGPEKNVQRSSSFAKAMEDKTFKVQRESASSSRGAKRRRDPGVEEQGRGRVEKSRRGGKNGVGVSEYRGPGEKKRKKR